MVQELTTENYNDIIENEYVLIDIWGPGCIPCQRLLPIIDNISNKYENLIVGKLDVSKNTEIISELNIRSVPTLLFYHYGEVVHKNVGMISEEKIDELLENIIL